MKTLTRVVGAVRLIGGLGVFVSMFGLPAGPLCYLMPLCGLGAGLLIKDGIIQIATGTVDR